MIPYLKKKDKNAADCDHSTNYWCIKQHFYLKYTFFKHACI